MARRYVRDSGGRFASKGGGGKRKGKLSKSTAGRSAKAKYKSATSKVRGAQRDFKKASKKDSAASGARTRAAKTGKNYQRAADRAYGASLARNKAARKITGAKSALTRTTNKLTKKGAAKARTGANKPGKMVPNANKLAQSQKYASARKAKKGSALRRDMVATARIRKGAKARASYNPKKESAAARQRLIKKSKSKRMESGTFKAPRGKVGKAKRSPAKKIYKKAKSNLRFEKRVGLESGSKNTRAIRASEKKLRELENVFRVKGRRG